MNFYHPELEQKVGTLIGGVIGFFKLKILTLVLVFSAPEWELVKNAAIGATVGFVITTLLRYVCEKIKERWSKK